MATLEPALHADLDYLNLFKASLCQDSDRLSEIAAVFGADSEAFQAVASLLPVPLLQACNRRLGTLNSEKLDGRVLSGLRCLAGICRSARHRAQPLFPLRPVWRRVAGSVLVLSLLRHDRP